jgi:hypothetical protein
VRLLDSRRERVRGKGEIAGSRLSFEIFMTIIAPLEVLGKRSAEGNGWTKGKTTAMKGRDPGKGVGDELIRKGGMGNRPW